VKAEAKAWTSPRRAADERAGRWQDVSPDVDEDTIKRHVGHRVEITALKPPARRSA
jgi:hypothetical protein